MKSLYRILTALKLNLLQFLRKALFLVPFILLVSAVNAQNPDNSGNPQVKDDGKVKFVLKPNSREEKVVMRDNNLKRIDKQRRQATIQKLHQLRKKRITMMKMDKNRRQEMMQRKKLMMQKRKSLRK